MKSILENLEKNGLVDMLSEVISDLSYDNLIEYFNEFGLEIDLLNDIEKNLNKYKLSTDINTATIILDKSEIKNKCINLILNKINNFEKNDIITELLDLSSEYEINLEEYLPINIISKNKKSNLKTTNLKK